MTHNRSWIFSIIVLLLGAMVFSGTATAASGAEVQRPLKASVEFSDAEPLFVCDPGLVPGAFVGTGNMSHLGRVELSGGLCQDFVNGTLTDGFVKYVGANGDYIEVTFVGVGFPTSDGFEGATSATITGGAGRFEEASGEFESTFTTVVFPDGSTHTTLDSDGWITYDASNSRNR